MAESESTGSRRAWAARLAQFVALLGVYGLLTLPVEPAEWAAGAVAAALATVGASAVAARMPPWSVRLGGVARLLGLVPRMVAEGVRITLEALAPSLPEGAFRVVPIDPGGDDAESVGRRGLVVAGASLAPNGVVVTLDRERGAMLVHQLLPPAGPPGGEDREHPL